MKGHSILLIAGGLGLAPLRSPIIYVTENRADYDQVHILYGTTDPSQLLFDYQYEQWRRVDGVNLSIIVDRPDTNWKGKVGMVTKLLENVRRADGRYLRHRLRSAGHVQVRLHHAQRDGNAP